MIGVGVGQQDVVDRLSSERERPVVQLADGLGALEEAAIDQEPATIMLDQVAATGDGRRGAVKGQADRHGSLRSRSLPAPGSVKRAGRPGQPPPPAGGGAVARPMSRARPPARAKRRSSRCLLRCWPLLPSRSQSPRVASTIRVRPISCTWRRRPEPSTRAASRRSCTSRDRSKTSGTQWCGCDG